MEAKQYTPISQIRNLRYFGGSENFTRFLSNGILMARVGGAIAGILLFTNRGRRILASLGL